MQPWLSPLVHACCVGVMVGADVGAFDVGDAVGASEVGDDVGDDVGAAVGAFDDGAAVGAWVVSTHVWFSRGPAAVFSPSAS